MNKVKEKLKKGEVAYGQMVLELFSAGVGLMLAVMGMVSPAWAPAGWVEIARFPTLKSAEVALVRAPSDAVRA